MSLNKASLWVCVLLAMMITGLNACTRIAFQPTPTPTVTPRVTGGLIRFRGNFFQPLGNAAIATQRLNRPTEPSTPSKMIGAARLWQTLGEIPITLPMLPTR